MDVKVTAQLDKILAEYSGKIDEAVEIVTKEIATETVKELKDNSPKSKGGGEYAKGWTKKKVGKGIIVHNRYYQLTHLLEKGHVVANQYGNYPKRVAAIPHIEPIEKKMNEKYVERLKKEIEK